MEKKNDEKEEGKKNRNWGNDLIWGIIERKWVKKRI